jgi:ABC-type multidrug transport system fused ATPase/permease subunit
LTKEEQAAADKEAEARLNASATKKLLKYLWVEWHMFFWGIITLIGGNLGQLVIPYYVGLFVDRIVQKKFEEVYTLCWQLVVINLVSY